MANSPRRRRRIVRTHSSKMGIDSKQVEGRTFATKKGSLQIKDISEKELEEIGVNIEEGFSYKKRQMVKAHKLAYKRSKKKG